MKTKIAAAILATAAMVTAACEQHKWSETSQLFKPHGEHAEHAEHGAAAGHGEAAAHGEKKAEGHGEAAKH
jgi:hypothetical protein